VGRCQSCQLVLEVLTVAVVEQLPLEVHRNYALLRELEHQMQCTRAVDVSAPCSHTRSTASQIALRERVKAFLADPDAPTAPDSSSHHTPSQQASRAGTPSSQDAVRHLLVPSGSEQPGDPSRPPRKLLEEIARHSRVAIRCGEDKVGLAGTVYDSVRASRGAAVPPYPNILIVCRQVDRHIRRLDADLRKCEDNLVLGLRPGTLPSTEAPSIELPPPPLPPQMPLPPLSASAAAITTRSADIRRAQEAKEAAEQERRRKLEEELEQQRRRKGLKLDLAVDPNEPTYCYCDRVSFGEASAHPPSYPSRRNRCGCADMRMRGTERLTRALCGCFY
jgi:hypothetical protein